MPTNPAPAAAQAAQQETRTLNLARPAQGQTVVPSEEEFVSGSNLKLGFDLGDARISVEGDNLVLTFEDQGKIELHDFYNKFSKEQKLIDADGNEIEAAVLETLGGREILETALGPSAAAAMNRGRYNEYGDLDLLDGIDHLRELDWACRRKSIMKKPARPAASMVMTMATRAATTPARLCLRALP